jgi:hypothetical protein
MEIDQNQAQMLREARVLLAQARDFLVSSEREQPDAHATLYRVYVEAICNAWSPRSTILRLAYDLAVRALADAIPNAAPRRKAACPDHVAVLNYNSSSNTTRQDLLALFDRALGAIDEQLAHAS